MKGVAILLIAVAAVLCVLRPPGLYDSKARHDANHRYANDPSETNRMALDTIKQSEHREILMCSVVSFVLFGTGIILLFRTKNNQQGSRSLICL